jgi:DNA adenine methylase
MFTEGYTVKPLKGIAAYIGGKRRLAKELSGRIDQIPHRVYAEPFVGMGGVFFARTIQKPCEIINDVNRELVTLYRILQRHYDLFLHYLQWYVTSRSIFEDMLETPPHLLTDIERAARFFYLQRTAFGGKVTGQAFGMDTSPARFNIRNVEQALKDYQRRLVGVTVENMTYARLIERYDTPETLFYLDPPYYDCENDYGKGVFGKEDFRRLAEMLAGIQGQFILSLNDVPPVWEIFKPFSIETVRTEYTISSECNQEVTEVIITGT